MGRGDEWTTFAWSGSYPYDDPPYDPPPPTPAPPDEPKPEPSDPPADPPAPSPGGPGEGRGLVCGRFMPPHRGHEYYVEFAARWTRELTVLLFSYPGDPIAGALREGWLREMFPRAHVVHAADVEPPPREAKDFWARWANILRRYVPAGPDYFFTGDARAARIAERLGAQHVLVDSARAAVPISATMIRERPLAHFDFLPSCVRPYYAKRVSVLGPESTGKTTLVERLAEHYRTAFVPEYARVIAQARGRAFGAEDVETIARGQIASEDALARQANRVLFSDTDLRAVRLWSERLFDRCPPWIAERAAERRYDLTFVTAADVPFVGVAAHDQPALREAFQRRCASIARDTSGAVVALAGTWSERWETARAAVDRLLEISRRGTRG